MAFQFDRHQGAGLSIGACSCTLNATGVITGSGLGKSPGFMLLVPPAYNQVKFAIVAEMAATRDYCGRRGDVVRPPNGDWHAQVATDAVN